MRVLVLVAAAAFAAGCTSVKMVRREGCWIKRTEKIFGRVHEEIGPCAREAPRWAEDRHMRLVQECVAQADYRWQARALEAWSRSRPMPAQPPQEETLRTCMEEARVGLVNENEELKRQLSQLSADRDATKAQLTAERDAMKAQLTAERDAMQAESVKDRAHLRASQEELAKYLGEAANRPAPSPVATATATSTSDGKATNESGATLATESGSAAGARDLPAAAIPAAATHAPPLPAAAAPPPAPAAAPPAEDGTPRAPAARPATIGRARRPPAQPVRAVARDLPTAKGGDAPCAVAAEAPGADAARP
jgi:hypothetical protein